MRTGQGPESGQIWTQSQTKQDDQREVTGKDCPHASALNHLQGLCRSFSSSVSLSAHPVPQLEPAGAFSTCIFSPSLLTLCVPQYSPSLCQILSAKGRGLGTYIKTAALEV